MRRALLRAVVENFHLSLIHICDALFEAALEDNRLSGLSDEVKAVKEIIAANDDLYPRAPK